MPLLFGGYLLLLSGYIETLHHNKQAVTSIQLNIKAEAEAEMELVRVLQVINERY